MPAPLTDVVRLRVLFLGTWVPRECGIATFTRDLRNAVQCADPGIVSAVLAIDEPETSRTYGPEVVARIRQDDGAAFRAAADVVASWNADIVNVQHEFGLYGTHGEAGYVDHLTGFLAALAVPVVVTLHTLPAQPPEWMRRAVREISDRSAAVVVMADTAAELLRTRYGVRSLVFVVPHGSPGLLSGGREAARRMLGLGDRQVISTFGLVSRGKGLEYAIQALPGLVDRFPDALYVIAGRTHPEVVRHEGEVYREHLHELVQALGLEQHVLFMNEYLSLEKIGLLLRATDVFVTPYLDRDQITSGSLAYALGAGCPIVSTPYLHATEALAGGCGMLVDFRSASAIAEAVGRLLGDPALRDAMAERARNVGRRAEWPAVGIRTVDIMRGLAGRPRAAEPKVNLDEADPPAPTPRTRSAGDRWMQRSRSTMPCADRRSHGTATPE